MLYILNKTNMTNTTIHDPFFAMLKKLRSTSNENVDQLLI